MFIFHTVFKCWIQCTAFLWQETIVSSNIFPLFINFFWEIGSGCVIVGNWNNSSICPRSYVVKAVKSQIGNGLTWPLDRPTYSIWIQKNHFSWTNKYILIIRWTISISFGAFSLLLRYKGFQLLCGRKLLKLLQGLYKKWDFIYHGWQRYRQENFVIISQNPLSEKIIPPESPAMFYCSNSPLTCSISGR